MAWNGSNTPNNSPGGSTRSPSPSAPRKTYLRGLLAGLLVVAAGGATLWYLGRDGVPSPSAKDEPDKASGTITEVKPAAAPTNSVAAVAEEEKLDPNSLEWHKKYDPRYAIPPGSYRDERGILRTPTGRRILEELPTRFLSTRRSDHPRIFQSSAEDDIAKLITLKPGQFFMPTTYGQRFLRSFKKSLEQPTLVLESDSEETKALKRQVNEVKAELKTKMDAGEDISQIMQDTENEFRALNAYKKDLVSELRTLQLKEDISQKDYDDYVAAANVMLKERGMGEIKLPAMHEAKLQHAREVYRQRQAEKAAAAEKSSK